MSTELMQCLIIKVYISFRVLSDYQTKLGEEYILSSFPFEADKITALRILQTVSITK